MGDDFDLFPKRENLDPFSFGTKDRPKEPRKEEPEDLFGKEEQEAPPTLPDLPLGEPELDIPEPPLTPPAARQELPSAAGPISEEKTFDEPSFESEAPAAEKKRKAGRKSPSPFIVVGGAIIIILGLLYGALTYLKRDKPIVATAPVSVAVVPQPSQEVPVPKTEEPPATSGETPSTEAQSPGQPAESPVVPAQPQPEKLQPAKPAPAPEPVSKEPVKEAAVAVPVKEKAPKPAVPAPAPEGGLYSVQVGALILESSVTELEKKLQSLGYDPLLREGSTTAMMNMLTVGPFATMSEAQGALGQLKGAGIDSTLRRRTQGGAVIYAGSYLLEENARSIMAKIRSFGLPVSLSRKETKLPMTFVRVGSYDTMDEATRAREELKGKGFEAIVVKLR
ncbi:MAG: SPOR domain-containing protein [bacterium]|nr:MAG: SPOR domain-containing protein [bacterium]